MRELKEAILRIEKEMSGIDGSISNKYWILQGLNKAWEILHKVGDDFTSPEDDTLKINNSYNLLKEFKVYYDKVDGNIIFPDSHTERIVTEFITEKLTKL